MKCCWIIKKTKVSPLLTHGVQITPAVMIYDYMAPHVPPPPSRANAFGFVLEDFKKVHSLCARTITKHALHVYSLLISSLGRGGEKVAMAFSLSHQPWWLVGVGGGVEHALNAGPL